MWLKLTTHDGNPVRVNMANVSCYYPHEEKDSNAKTFLEGKYLDNENNVTGQHVKETMGEIDEALRNEASLLRVVRKISGEW